MSIQLRGIVIEDDFLLSETLREALETLGCKVLAQAATLQDGQQLAASTDCDFAVVGDLNGEMAFALLDALKDRGIPFVMATAASADEIPAKHAGAARLSKPYDLQELRHVIESFSRRRVSQSA